MVFHALVLACTLTSSGPSCATAFDKQKYTTEAKCDVGRQKLGDVLLTPPSPIYIKGSKCITEDKMKELMKSRAATPVPAPTDGTKAPEVAPTPAPQSNGLKPLTPEQKSQGVIQL